MQEVPGFKVENKIELPIFLKTRWPVFAGFAVIALLLIAFISWKLAILILFVFLTIFSTTLAVTLLGRNRQAEKDFALLNTEFNDKIQELGTLNALLAKLSALKNMDELLGVLSTDVAALLDCSKILVFVKNEDKDDYKYDGIDFDPSKDMVFDEINRLKQPLIFFEKELKALLPSINSKTKMYNALFVPLMTGKEVVAVACCINKRKGFDDDDLRKMDMIAPQISALLQNALLLERTNSKTAELEKFNNWLKKSRRAFTNILEDINRANNDLEKALHQTLTMYKIAVELSKSLDERRLLQIILTNSADLIGANSASLVLTKGSKLEQASDFNYKGDLLVYSENTPLYWIKEKKKPLIINDFRRTHYRAYKLKAGVKNMLGVPLIQDDRCLGVLCLFDKRDGFSRDDCQNLVTLAHQATVTLLNARIHENEKKMITKLKEIDKMKADFVASVSHELRSPLTTIKGYLDLLSEGQAGAINKQQSGFLSIIDQSSERLLNLINDLLMVSKIESDNLRIMKQEVSVNNIFQRVTQGMIIEAKQKGLKLKVNLAKSLPFVQADPERLEQVVINLISNAIKFTPKGGLIELKCEAKSGNIVTSVKDTGSGISNDDQKQLFDKFYRSQDAVTKNIKGTGLGLAIVKGIIEQHKGKVWLESKIGKGSTFFFSLPIKKKTAA